MEKRERDSFESCLMQIQLTGAECVGRGLMEGRELIQTFENAHKDIGIMMIGHKDPGHTLMMAMDGCDMS